MAPNSNEKCQVMMLCYKKLIQTKSDGSEAIYELDTPEIEGIGPHLEGMTPHTLLESSDASFQWKVVYWWSLDGRTWVGPANMFADSTTGVPTIHAEVTDPTTFGLHMKWGLACSAVSGSSRLSGSVTVALVLKKCT